MELIHIEIDENYGSASGYVVESTREQVGNYLSEYSEHSEKIADWLKENVQFIGILKNLNVEENKRGNGYGNELLERFLGEAEQEMASAVILISDDGELQADGFVLDRWYEGYGFVSVQPTSAGPFMVYPEEIGERIKSELFPEA